MISAPAGVGESEALASCVPSTAIPRGNDCRLGLRQRDDRGRRPTIRPGALFVSLCPAMTPLRATRSISGRFLCPETLQVIGILLLASQPAQPERNRNTLDSALDESS